MKLNKIYLTALLFFVTYSCFSQLEKGSIAIGGLSSFNTTNFKQNKSDFKYKKINIAPNFSFFIMDGLSIGAKLKYNYAGSKKPLRVQEKYSFGGVFRYYFLFNNWSLFPEYTISKDFIRKKSSSNTEKGYGSSQSLGLGFTYFISKKVGVELLISYQNQKLETTRNQIFIPDDSIVSYDVGFQVYLNKND